MTFSLGTKKELEEIASLDRHITKERLLESVCKEFVYTARDKNGSLVGVLRYSLFWQTFPFLDLIYLKKSCRRKGVGKKLLEFWENEMARLGFSFVLTSTQADEDAYLFYETLGYEKCGAFSPPLQEAEEWIYKKKLSSKIAE